MRLSSLITAITLLGYSMTCNALSPNETKEEPRIKVWSTKDNAQVVINVPRENVTYYFNNNEDRLCYSFFLRGDWKPTSETGFLVSEDGEMSAGVLLLSNTDLEAHQGEDLLSRAVSLHLADFTRRAGNPAASSKVESFESVYDNSILWIGQWHLPRKGEEYIAEARRYIAEVHPGWVVAVTASKRGRCDECARNVMKSLSVTSEPGCYLGKIQELRKSQRDSAGK